MQVLTSTLTMSRNSVNLSQLWMWNIEESICRLGSTKWLILLYTSAYMELVVSFISKKDSALSCFFILKHRTYYSIYKQVQNVPLMPALGRYFQPCLSWCLVWADAQLPGCYRIFAFLICHGQPTFWQRWLVRKISFFLTSSFLPSCSICCGTDNL